MSGQAGPPPARPLGAGWRWLEAWFGRRYGIRALHTAPDCLLAYNLYLHSGPDVLLADGCRVRRGECVLEVHFRREALLPLIADGDPARMGLGLLRLGDRDVPRLARALEEEPGLREVRAVHALTLFHRGISRYGFEAHDVQPPWVAWWFTAYHRMLLARDHAHGAVHVREHRDRLVTRHVWICREALIRRCAASGASEARAAGRPEPAPAAGPPGR